MGKVERAAYAMMETSDRATATPVWLAKYYELTEKGLEHEEAVRDADALVRKYFPSSDPSARANWLRDRGVMGHLTFLYGFANKLYNIDRRTIVHAYDQWREPTAGAADRAKAVGAAMFTLTAQAAVIGVAGDFLSGRGPKKDEGAEGVPAWALERLVSTVGYQLPFTQLVFGGRGALPASGLLHKVLTEAKGIASGERGAAESIAALGAAAMSGAGMAQFTRSGKYIDENLMSDLRRGRYGRAASASIFGDRDVVTPLDNPLSEQLSKLVGGK